MQPSVQGWLEYLENLGGYHKFRWGDAPVHTFTAALHLKRAQMLWFDFDYKHGQRYLAGDCGPVKFDALPKLKLAGGNLAEEG